ncbi:MAG: NTP/NDP exchange transporter [Holosporales bacterium]|jgi:AAA family ATP:ADP antiporter|nr:NTP/NDP exchange transporter [Holosporales bacterium]
MSDTEKQPEFTEWRAIFWPIHTFELKKFLPMGFIMLCILFNYSTLRTTKDSLVVPLCGAEIISALKLWAVLPSAVLIMLLYSKLSNALSKPNLFYTMLSLFLVFFASFALFLYPNHESLHPDFSELIGEYPRLKWILLVGEKWTFSLFYVMAELWGSVVMTLLFWQFANDITKIKEAKRFYGMFGVIGNVALLFSGSFIKKFSSIQSTYPEGTDVWGITINWLVGASIVSGICIILLYWWMQKNVLTDIRFYNPDDVKKPKKKKEKLSLLESFKYIFSSKYVGFIALLPICYGISINLVEGVWKGQVGIMFPNHNDYSAFMGQFQIYTGLVSIICMFIGANILRKFSWYTAAIVTPLMILVTGGAFFAFIICDNAFESMLVTMGVTCLAMTVAFGQIQNVLSKATKYSLFDATKEMSYIPLDDELKMKGKAAVDVVGGRFGKSGGAAVQYILLASISGSTLVSLAPIMSAIFICVMVLWIWAVSGLSKEFEAVTKA